MDHIRVLNQIRNIKNITKAFYYAHYDRLNSDYFFDYFEIEFIENNKDKIIEEVVEELKDLENYTQRPAYSYFPPKTDLCFRRMIYIPFKDLIIRYAFVIVIADLLDDELSSNCFANRRAKGEQSKISLLENFAEESWPNFCEWQKKCIDSNEVLLRTDISSFYDSVSHDYLIRTISEHLSIDSNTQVMKLFKKILLVPVISYSQLNKKTKSQRMRQGLPIGNSTEGVLANIYLKNKDDAMSEMNEIQFGRYSDDMRIFGKNRKDVLNAMLVLQELLLTKGLNLNAGKTQIAENEEEIEKLRTKFYDVSGGYIEQEFDKIIKINNIENDIDLNFDEFDRVFEIDYKLQNHSDAKDYCKYLSVLNKEGEELLKLKDRKPEHIEKLEEIITKWAGSTRHAVWLIVQSAFYTGVANDTKDKARKTIFNLLKNVDVSSYGKYRIIHHIIKLRKNKKQVEFRFLDMLSKEEKEKLIKLVPSFLQQPAFELNLIGLYLLRILGFSPSELKNYANDYVIKPIGEPIKNALSYVSESPDISESFTTATDREPDAIPSPY